MKSFVGTVGTGVVVIAVLYILLNNYKNVGAIASNTTNQVGRLESTFQGQTK